VIGFDGEHKRKFQSPMRCPNSNEKSYCNTSLRISKVKFKEKFCRSKDSNSVEETLEPFWTKQFENFVRGI